jgi:hypothetical protein
LESHSWDEYSEWRLGLTCGAAEATKAPVRLRLWRLPAAFTELGLIACHYRAAEWRHKEIELEAHELLQLLDATTD